jgi:hypothetical protein
MVEQAARRGLGHVQYFRPLQTKGNNASFGIVTRES